MLSLLFASALGFVLRVRQKSRQEAQRLAYVDPVTGLYNKNRFRLEATRRLERQAGPPMAVMIFNLSGFRTVNELFGFAEGDRLLAAVGRMLQKELGESDLYARGEADNFYLLTGRYSPQAVSYTPLDVYKRQGPGNADTFCPHLPLFILTDVLFAAVCG